MTSRNTHCWEITNCGHDDCFMRQYHGEKQCWEVAGELDDYRSAMDVCRDCIVYLAKQEVPKLTEAEVTVIKGSIGEKQCWEVASQLDDGRNAMNVCRECIVYLAKQKDPKLTEAEITVITEKKGSIGEKQCWEIASELDDCRKAMNVCRKCIVYLTKQKDSGLTEAEITVIKGCILAKPCPGYQSTMD